MSVAKEMERFEVQLTSDQFERLEVSAPRTGNHSSALRAVAVARLYLAERYPGHQEVKTTKGADLTIQHEGLAFDFEIKGTAGQSISVATIKVSSEDSYRLIIGGMPVLRVTEVYGRVPVVYVLSHGKHFVLKSESRWTGASVKLI